MQLTGAERAAGIVFREDFRNAALYQRNGSHLGSGSSIDVNGLSSGTGLAQSSLPIPLDGSEYSMMFRFTPTFAWDNGVSNMLLDSEAAARSLYVYKSSSGALSVKIGSRTMTFNGGAGTWSDYWLLGAENVFVASFYSGATSFWLNGFQFTSTAGFVPSQLRTLTYMSNYIPAVPATGYMREIMLIDHAISAEDEPVLREGRLISDILPDRSLVTLPLERDYAVSGVQSTPLEGTHKAVLDHAQMGDGVTASTYPTKLPSKKGYSFDGGDYILVPDHDDLSMVDGSGDVPFTIAVSMTASDLQLAGSRSIVGKCSVSGADKEWLLHHASPGRVYFRRFDDSTGGATLYQAISHVMQANVHSVIICTYDGLLDYVYVDAVLVPASRNTFGTYNRMQQTIAPLYVGKGVSLQSYGHSSAMIDSGVDGISLYKNLCASPMQVKALTHMIGEVQ